MAPSARAFGAGLRPWPSATINYYLCNFCHPARPSCTTSKVEANSSAGPGHKPRARAPASQALRPRHRARPA
eukprot:scaffold7993_cov21-Phaeocystis_antarctica.AAC.1